MSTCKDCIHGDVCKAHVIEGVGIDFTTFEKLIEKNGCNQFKDRSKFIELPCKVGDTVYFINALKERE